MTKTNYSDIFLSVIIPQYNELANLKKDVLKQVSDFLTSQNYKSELIISDDGSTDGSFEYIQDLIKNLKNTKQVRGRHGGKAVALMNGISESNGKYILISDMDQSTPIEELNKLLPFINENYEVVIGSRGNKRNNTNLVRKFASFLFSTFRKLILLQEIDDTQCGFKLFESNLGKKIFPMLEATQEKKISGWTVSAFDVEFLFLAKKFGNKIKEVKVIWRDEDESDTKSKKGKFVKESLDMLKQILRVRINDLKGKYKN